MSYDGFMADEQPSDSFSLESQGSAPSNARSTPPPQAQVSPAIPAAATEPLRQPDTRVKWLAPARPELNQMLRNVRVWLPFLANPVERSLLIRYPPDLDRVGLTWRVALPRLCWHCARAEQLLPRNYETTLRSFEYPMGIVIGTAAIALLGLMIALAWPVFGLLLFLFSLLIGGAVLWLKSWTEQVQVTLWTCPEHAGPMLPPGMAIDDQQLHLFLGHADVLQAAQEELLERRRSSAGRRALGATGASTPRSVAPPLVEAPTSVPRPNPVPSKPADMPPIKLADDE